MPTLKGPRGAIEYERDALGYPSIRARDLLEGTFALGYFHAHDRLTQISLLALGARGELMSVLGDVPFVRLIDRSMKILGPTAELEQQVEKLDAETRALLDAYCAGFALGAKVRGRPLVLRLLRAPRLDYTPALLAAVFRFVMYFGLTSTQLSTELVLAELAQKKAPRRLFEKLLGDKARGLDLDDVGKVEIPPEFSFFTSLLAGSPLAGSNAFAVAKERSASGGALLMGEFHMDVGRFPPIMYAAHIELSDGNYLSGMTIPGLAWLVAGRTRHVGWSYTFAHADNVDILVERVKDGQYLAGSEYRPFRRRTEEIVIRGRPHETWEFYENDYGVLLGDAKGEGHRACVRLSGMSELHRALAASRRLVECRTVDDLVAVNREVRTISLEAILCDAAGSIASVVTGQVDERADGWTGAYPRRGWDLASRSVKAVSEEERPVLMRPASGVVGSANQGGQGEARRRWCSFPEPIARFERIGELLGAREKHDLKSLQSISYDDFDRLVSRFMAIWGPLLAEHPLARELAAWAPEQRPRRDAKLLGLFHKLHEEVYFVLLEQDLDRKTARRFGDWSALIFFQAQVDEVLALERPELLDHAGLRALLAEAWPRALAGYEAYPVPVKLRFKHLVTRGRTPAFLGFDSKEVELPGSPTTLFQSRVCEVAGEKLVYAPAFHLCFDMSQDGAWYNLPGGASESRFGVGYGKGIREWLGGELLPLGGAPRLHQHHRLKISSLRAPQR